MILHIPHSSRIIPEELRGQFVLSDLQLEGELTRTTDAYVDELFSLAGTRAVAFPLSRLVVDVERFRSDDQEEMSRVGMGMVYTRTADGQCLRRGISPGERASLERLYDEHHQALESAVEEELERLGRALIVDCHSFPDQPLPCDRDRSAPRPDLCVGTNPFHTPTVLAGTVVRKARELGYRTMTNSPYSGALVPMAFYGKDQRVSSVMIEVNRRLYMDEALGDKTPGFGKIKEDMTVILEAIWNLGQKNLPGVA
jgi:N-formylglutamate amidohydrolase